MLTDLFSTVIGVSFSASMIIVGLLLLSPLLNKHYGAKWSYWTWLVLAVRLLLPFNLRFLQPPVELSIPTEANFFSYNTPQLISNIPTEPASSQALLPQIPSSQAITYAQIAPHLLSPVEMISIIWLAGTVLFLIYQFTAYFLFKRKTLRWSKPIEDTAIMAAFVYALTELHIHRNIILKQSKTVFSPMMTGFFRPILFLPDETYPIEDYPVIFKHELIHCKRRDIWYKLLMVCVNAVHWFNPFIYLMVHEAGKDIEVSCDDEVIRNTSLEFRKQYSETILSVIHAKDVQRTSFSTYFNGGKKAMKQRFKNILDMSKKRRGIVSLCAVILVTCAAGTLVVFAVDKEPIQQKGPAVQTISVVKSDKNNLYQCLQNSIYKDYRYYKDLNLDQNTLSICSNIEKYYKDYLINGIVDSKKVISFSRDYDFTMLLVDGANVKETKKGIFCLKTDIQQGEPQYDFSEVDFSDLKRPTIRRIATITPTQSTYFQYLFESWKFFNQQTDAIANSLSIDLSQYQRITSADSPKFGEYHLQQLESSNPNIEGVDKGSFRRNADDTKPEFFLNREETGGIILKQSQNGTCYSYTYVINSRPGNLNGSGLKVTSVKTAPGKYVAIEDYRKANSLPASSYN